MVVGHDPDEMEDEEDTGILPLDSLTVESSVDLLSGLNLGSYSSNVMTLDLKDMKFEQHPFNINKYYQDVSVMNSRITPEFYQRI